ncbi:MAG: hypothetical protein P8107_15425, partial [Spirochaetia bacterium]
MRAAGGYLGAENQAIRVQLTDANHFTWGFDNASLLFKVRISENKKVTFITRPKDSFQWPGVNEVVEVLNPAALLPNNEKIADLTGHLSNVAELNREAGELILKDSAGFDEKETYFLRVWKRGMISGENPPTVRIQAEGNILGHTGVKINITGGGGFADYWIITVRPETPDILLPRQLLTGMTPMGLKFYYTPLALIKWKKDATRHNSVVGEIISDCRKRFFPLTQQHLCCTIKVGDGIHSFGHTDSIQEAVSLVPDGGRICLLPGYHRAHIRLVNRRNLVLSGCANQSFIVPTGTENDAPLLLIRDSDAVTVEGCNFSCLTETAVEMEATVPGTLKQINIKDNNIV